MNKQIEALKMAIEALESIELLCDDKRWYLIGSARKACKEALAEAEKQEPVAWLSTESKANEIIKTHPATWQSLSDDEINEIWVKSFGSSEIVHNLDFARAIEKALKEKNHG